MAIGADEPNEQSIAAAVADEPRVLILDNFEQVLAAAPGVASLLGASASLTFVVTSRAPLHIAGERELPLPPLASDPAVELFVRRAREQDARFDPGPDDLGQIAAICERIDGLPLAIELAAARTRVLTPKQILERIGRRLDLLSGGRRDAPERHRTLRATIAWSYELLEPAERWLLAELAVFRGGWSLEASEAVAGGDVLDALTSLVDHSLVTRNGDRFTMLETVREYAAERLEESGETGLVAQRHALWCVLLAEAGEVGLQGAEQSSWFQRLDAEHENLRSAAAWGAADGEPEVTLAIDGALWRYWLARGAAAEARQRLKVALATERGDPALRARAFNAAGAMAGAMNDFSAAGPLFAEARELAGHLNDPRQLARSLMNLGMVALYTEEYESALVRYAEAGEIWRELGEARGQSIMCQNMAIVHGLMDRVDLAVPLLEQSVALARTAGDPLHLASTSVDLAKQLIQHHPEDPRIPELLREGLELCSAFDERRQILECLEVLAARSARTGAPDIAAELIGAAVAERDRTGIGRMPDERPLFDATVRELEDSLGRCFHARARARQ